MQRGERIFAAVIGVFGLLWIWKSTELTYLDYYAPGPGFLPLWLGALLVVLVLVFFWSHRGTEAPASPHHPARWWSIVIGLAVTVGLVEPLGFMVPVALYLLFLLKRVEQLPWRLSLLVAAGTSLAIFGVFHLWLSVPLPRGPWGF
ncbi:Tripartite tricarboxylate transporter TctB family protein [Variovorax sp. PBL-H6]|uniref:tripartite tricarboxylate transporter TctB family protein n=1 Tax=Variovorax sp. PBL-H6 TaxID=434009 RepID=UPI0013176C45|nr:tripartite tricarboxylate transporter TctB family protein [Variovorax sp. PBL-H6]VTU39536.1 Tripartite tricarboxylate transporter TctB family protein [Variovorax sp. PBL-H6]